MAPESCLKSDRFHRVMSLEATSAQAEEFENEKNDLGILGLERRELISSLLISARITCRTSNQPNFAGLSCM